MVEAIVGHLVGDYLLQNDWMAANKKHSSAVCAVHCFVWTTSVCLFGGLSLLAGCILFACHFLQDRTCLAAWYMQVAGQRQFRDGPLSPWSEIVVDNVWHVVTIWAVCRFI